MNENSHVSRFFQNIDAPMMLFLFEIDEALVGVGVFFTLMIGTMLSGVIIGGLSFMYITAAVLVAYYYRKYKKNKPDGYTFQMLYKFGYFHPSDFKRRGKSIRKKNNFKVIPTYYTKKLKGQ